MSVIREATVAGTFYPADPEMLRSAVAGYLSAAQIPEGTGAAVPKAVIAPHAGYVYSGPVAATAYAAVERGRDRITRVVLLGPSHRVALRGLALPGSDAYGTPLGAIPIDRESCGRVAELPHVQVLEEAHTWEHSLEVHLPFLQEVLGSFSLVPLVVGDADADEVSQVLEELWGGPETLIVISTDLSHYLSYDKAREMDGITSRAIQELRPEEILTEQACGRVPVIGLLALARKRGMSAAVVDLRNSGDTEGPRNQVVGYGSFLFWE